MHEDCEKNGEILRTLSAYFNWRLNIPRAVLQINNVLPAIFVVFS